MRLKVSEQYNLKILFPEIAAEWDHEANDLCPEEIAPYSGRKVAWQCSFNPDHKWDAVIYDRTRRGQGCPECNKENRSSFPEQAIFYYAKKHFRNCRNRAVHNGYEVDIYIPQYQLGIEYNGIFHKLYHREAYDAQKKDALRSMGITLLTIQEEPEQQLPVVAGGDLITCRVDPAYSYLNQAIQDMFAFINRTYDLSLAADIDIARDSQYIRTLLVQGKKKNSIAEKFPLLALEWHEEANWPITAEMVSYGSGAKYTWRCRHGHVWRESPNKRTNRGTGCPFCSGHRVSNANRLSKVKPKIARMWDKEVNGALTPDDVSFGSHRVVGWMCRQGHRWKRSVKDMVDSGKCPYCNGRRLTRETSLAARHPSLLEEWDFEKNEISPWEISPANNAYVWWSCKQGHSWKAKISNRSALGRGCPYCAKRRATAHENLAVQHPELAAEWNFGKNGDLHPTDVRPHSNKPVWWICPQGHEWESPVYQRVAGGNCPQCRSRYVRGGNSLLKTHPEVAARWHPAKNDGLLPRNFSAGSGKDIWWQCEKHAHHEWRRRISHEVGSLGCPYCAGLRVCKENSFAVLYPELVSEWDQQENGTLHPHDVTAQSTRVVGWICKECRHKWKASVQSRTAGKTCPHCNN